MSAFTILGLVIFLIQIFQLIFPEAAIFGVEKKTSDFYGYIITDSRNNMFRYRMESYMITIFCLYYYWTRALRKPTLRNVVLFAVFAISLYLYLTRQIIFSVLVTLLLSLILSKEVNLKVKIILILGAVFFLGFKFSGALFGSFVENFDTEISVDNVRVSAVLYYVPQIFKNPMVALFGNGHADSFNEVMESDKIYPIDIGFIGEGVYYGLIWILFYFVTVAIILIKYRKAVPKYVKLYVFGTFLNSILIFPYRNGYEVLVWTIVLYLSSVSIMLDKNKLNDSRCHS